MPNDSNNTVNSQIVDAVTQTSVAVIGDSPAFAMGTLYQASAQSLALMLQNAAANQHAMQQVNTACVSTAVAKILALAPK